MQVFLDKLNLQTELSKSFDLDPCSLPCGKSLPTANSPEFSNPIDTRSARVVEDADPYDGGPVVVRPPVGRRILCRGNGGRAPRPAMNGFQLQRSVQNGQQLSVPFPIKRFL